MENVGIFYDHLEYYMAIWYNLWPFVIVCDHLLYFSIFPVLVCLDPEKSGNPGRNLSSECFRKAIQNGLWRLPCIQAQMMDNSLTT
jgi:hypothetical protein